MNTRRPPDRVVFRPTGDAEFPYEALLQGRRWTVRVNNFPAQALYTLLVDGKPVEDLEEWPQEWVRPATDRL